MENFYSYPFFHDDVPIDISFVFESEKPAGKHGFLGVNGRKFQFADGTEAKFWGTNFNGAGCFPEHDYAKTVARRLAKIGINLVRFHQLDAQWHTPNIFQATKGKRVTDATFDPTCLDKLDYLIYCLKEEGIYVYLDMLTYRQFHSDEGVENAHILKVAAKPYSVFSRKLIQLQKEYCTALWEHVNPYTGLRYADEPAIVLTEIINECDLFQIPEVKGDFEEPYRTEFHRLFNRWLQEHNIPRRAEDICALDPDDTDLLNFKTDLQEDYYREMTAHMRSLGVKIPIAGTNWNSTPYNYRTQLVCDFIDTHPYFYNWNWSEARKCFLNKGISQAEYSFLQLGGLLSHAQRPTYISEWDMPWPNTRRAESVLYCAAIGAFQGWSGFTIHTYSYSTKLLERMNILGQEVSAPKLGGVPYRQGVFSTWNDPAKFGLFYHAALITRRGDVKEGDTLYGVDVPDLRGWDTDPLCNGVEKYKMVTSLGHKDGLPPMPTKSGETYSRSETGELFRDWEKEYGTIDTEMTKCVYGSLAANGTIALSGVRVRCETDYAVIAMSSLTDAPITQSDNILLTTVGRAENTDAKFDGDVMLDIGKPPVVIENIRAEIQIETTQKGLAVWAVSAEGYYIDTVPAQEQDGVLTFQIGDTTRSMYYLIVKT